MANSITANHLFFLKITRGTVCSRLLFVKSAAKAENAPISALRFSALSQVVWSETGTPSDASHHVRADFHAVMEGKDVIGPAGSRQHTVGGAPLSLECPTDPEQCRQHKARLG